MKKVSAPYPHDSRNMNAIYLAVTRGQPVENDWKAAYRDIVGRQRIVFAHFPDNAKGRVWIRDESGARPARSYRVH